MQISYSPFKKLRTEEDDICELREYITVYFNSKRYGAYLQSKFNGIPNVDNYTLPQLKYSKIIMERVLEDMPKDLRQKMEEKYKNHSSL